MRSQFHSKSALRPASPLLSPINQRCLTRSLMRSREVCFQWGIKQKDCLRTSGQSAHGDDEVARDDRNEDEGSDSSSSCGLPFARFCFAPLNLSFGNQQASWTVMFLLFHGFHVAPHLLHGHVLPCISASRTVVSLWSNVGCHMRSLWVAHR